MAGRHVSAPDRAQTIVLAWARAYTRGLDDDLRQRRLDELASDCHDQRHWGDEVGASPTAVATSLVARTLAGAPADLLWRQGQLATSRDRSPHPRGRPMGRWIRHNWWLALAAVLGSLHTALGVGLPFEDRTVGAAIGGVVIAGLGIGMLVGIWLRRRRRRLGDMLIAVGTLPAFPFFWTVVLPVLGLAVFFPAVRDAVDAATTGEDTVPTRPSEGTRRDVLARLAIAALGAAIVASLVVGTQTAAAALCAPPLAVWIAAMVRRRLTMPTRVADVGFTALVAGLAHAALLAVATIGGDGSVDLGAPLAVATGLTMSIVGVVGLVVWIVAMATTRDRARPA